MDFNHFRSLNGWTLERAADEMRASGDPAVVNITASMISRHERAVTFPNPAMIDRYAEITANAVQFQDWNRLRQEGGRANLPRGRRPKVGVG